MAEKKKILYIVEAMGGGVFTYIVDLANELVNSYDMYIAYAVRKQTPQNYKDYFDKRIHLIEVKNFGRAIDPAKDIAAFFEVKKIAAEIKPDVIHLHSSKAGAIGRVAFNGKIPMFYTPHGYSFLMENYKPMKRRMFKLIESVCAKRNCTTISCSVGEHQESLKLTKRATYVNNGINMAELQEIIDKTEKIEHPFTVYTLGRICYQKNPTLFNEIAESLPDVKFVWIGDGELRGELTSKNIEITGWADRSTAIRYAVNAQNCLLNQEEAVLHFLLEWPFTQVCWGRLYKRACIESVRFDETMRIAEDGKFFLDAIKNSHNVYFLSERSYFYFIREGSAVHSGFTEKYYDELQFCEDLVEQYRGKKELNMAAKINCYRFIIRLLRMPALQSLRQSTRRFWKIWRASAIRLCSKLTIGCMQRSMRMITIRFFATVFRSLKNAAW